MADYVGGDMVRGHIDTIILNSLIDGDKDSGLIKAEIEARADGNFQLKQGTFYSALQRIVKQGYVVEYRTTGNDGARRKFFQLTEKGKDYIEQNQSNWAFSQNVINKLLDTKPPVSENKVKSKSDEVVLPDFEPINEKVITFGELLENGNENSGQLPIDNFSENKKDINDNTLDDASKLDENVIDQLQNDEDVATFDDILSILVNNKQEDEKLNNKIVLNEYENEEYGSLDEVVENKVNKTYENHTDLLEKTTKISDEKEKVVNFSEIAQTTENNDNTANTQINTQNSPIQPGFNTNNNKVNEQQSIFDFKPIHFDNENKNLQSDIESVILQDKNKNENATFVQTHTQNFTNANNEVFVESDQIDDEITSTNKLDSCDYKNILTKIFGKENNTAVSNKNALNFETNSDSESVENEQMDQSVNDVYVDNLDLTFDPQKKIENDKIQANDILKAKKLASEKRINSNTIDYSDILDLAKVEGFKVNTSYQTNKTELGKILINKLNFHTSIIFFIMFFIETWLIYFSIKNLVDISVFTFIICDLLVLLLVIGYGITYSNSPKKTVIEISTFKNTMENVAIFTLNLFLIVIAYSIIINLDFSNLSVVIKYVVLPVIIVLNIPIYYIIKYLRLENQMYFS